MNKNNLGDIVTEQKLLEILNQLSNGGSALQQYITNTLTDRAIYEEFNSDRTKNTFLIIYFCFFVCLASMVRLYHHEYLTAECSTLPVIFFVESLMSDVASNDLIPFDTSLRTMLDEIMMWCVIEHLPEDLVRFLLSLLPDFNFKVIKTEKHFCFIE